MRITARTTGPTLPWSARDPAECHDARHNKVGPSNDTAHCALDKPAYIDSQLHRLGAGQQHAMVQGVQKPLRVKPAVLFDKEAVHKSGLPGRPAETQRPDAGGRGTCRECSARACPLFRAGCFRPLVRNALRLAAEDTAACARSPVGSDARAGRGLQALHVLDTDQGCVRQHLLPAFCIFSRRPVPADPVSPASRRGCPRNQEPIRWICAPKPPRIRAISPI